MSDAGEADCLGKAVAIVHPAWHFWRSHAVFRCQAAAYQAKGAWADGNVNGECKTRVSRRYERHRQSFKGRVDNLDTYCRGAAAVLQRWQPCEGRQGAANSAEPRQPA